MADLRTAVSPPRGLMPRGAGWGLDCWGAKTREEAIAEYRKHVAAKAKDAVAELSLVKELRDEDLVVEVHRGSKIVRRL